MIIALLIAFSIAEANPEAHIGFGSDCDSDLDIFWVNPQGEEVSVTKVAPQGQSWIGSYLNHKFVYRLNGKKVGEATVKSKSQFSVAQCGHPCHEHYGEEPCLERLDGRIRRAQLQPVWDSQNEDRRQTNRIQPQNLKNFTELGFEKRKIPDDVWELLRSYYENNKDSIVLEKWPSTNPYINHWESVPFMIWLPELHTGDETKRKIFEGLRPHLEEWSGTELEHTDLYGMRVYKNNTFLENHVDRVATHVVSAIMHIADKQDIVNKLTQIPEKRADDGCRYSAMAVEYI